MERYSRHISLREIGHTGQQKLDQAKVLVIGAGGLGCPVLQYLTAAGIGTIGIIDHDIVDISNLQRQVLFGSSALGKNKALAAKERLEDLNSEVTIEAYPCMLQPDNAIGLMDKYDIVVDGSDNFETRYLVNDAALLTNTPLVYGAVYKFEGQVSVFNFNNGPSYRCVFPEPPKDSARINCSEIGVLGVLPGIIGTMQANEVLKIILGIGSVLSGKLLCYNAKKTSMYTVEVKRNQNLINQVIARKDRFASQPFDLSCTSNEAYEISSHQLEKLKNVLFIDVREYHETPKFEQRNSIQIPLNLLQEQWNIIDTQKTIICICQSGTRSLKAAKLLRQKNRDAYSLKGGIMALIPKEMLES